MSRFLRFTFAILAPIALMIFYAVATYKPGLPGTAEALLQNSLHYPFAASQPTAIVEQIVEATRPGNFTPQMSKASFGRGVYYRTTFDEMPNYLPPTSTPWSREYSTPPATLPPWRSDFSSSSPGSRALPFPPSEVWCVRLRQPGSAVPSIVFVALHQDLYNADWVVHEPTAVTLLELNASLTRIGCDMAVKP